MAAETLPTVLIIGGVASDRGDIAEALRETCDCLQASTAGQAWQLMSDHFVQVVICAGAVDGADCLDVFDFLLNHWPETMLVAIADPEALSPDRRNIHGVLKAPWSPCQLRTLVQSATRVFQLTRENERLELEIRCQSASPRRVPAQPASLGFEGILRTPGSPMVPLVQTARQYASFDVPILISGEPGTGKAKLARAIHDNSLRSDKPFQSLDLTGMSEAAARLALFGRRKPANGTPPIQKAGLVHRAEQGTFFLCGVETASHDLQMQLLRLLRDGVFEPDGAQEPERSDARVITALSSEPGECTATGRLDASLYYAMSIAELSLPPLRDRKIDIPLLARAAADHAGHLHGKRVHGLSDAALEFLMAYDWPGNLWELENEITRMLILTQETELGADVISRKILQAMPGTPEKGEADILLSDGPLKDRVETIEARILLETLTRLKWNKSRSAAELGLSRVGLRAKLDRYGISPPQTEEA